MKSVDTRLCRGVPNRGDRMEANDTLFSPSGCPYLGFIGGSPRPAKLHGPEGQISS